MDTNQHATASLQVLNIERDSKETAWTMLHGHGAEQAQYNVET